MIVAKVESEVYRNSEKAQGGGSWHGSGDDTGSHVSILVRLSVWQLILGDGLVGRLLLPNFLYVARGKPACR